MIIDEQDQTFFKLGTTLVGPPSVGPGIHDASGSRVNAYKIIIIRDEQTYEQTAGFYTCFFFFN